MANAKAGECKARIGIDTAAIANVIGASGHQLQFAQEKADPSRTKEHPTKRPKLRFAGTPFVRSGWQKSSGFAARLKSCPDTKPRNRGYIRNLSPFLSKYPHLL